MKTNKNVINGHNAKVNQPKIRFVTMLIMIAIVPLIASIVIESILSLISLKSNLEKSSKDYLYVVASNLANHCNDEKISFATADRFNDYIDSLKERNIEMTILMDGAPSVSSIKNENGYRVRDIEAGEDITTSPELRVQGVYKDGVVIDGTSYYCCYVPLEVDGENLGVVMSAMPQSLIDAQTSAVVIKVVVSSLILIIAFSAVVLLVTKDIVGTFAVLDSNINNLAEGNLGNAKDKSSPVRELNSLVNASKVMNSRIEEIIGDVHQASDNLVDNVGDVTRLSKQNAAKAGDIAEAMRMLSESTMQMAEYVGDISVQMSDMDGSIVNINDSVNQLNDSSDELMQANDEARNNINLILDSNKQAFVAVNDISSQIKETNDAITNINAAVDIIIDIAGKTKLLSLNASIEAARAGEMGRGFAVVADEIRQLSEQSSRGAETIRNLANTIVEKSSRSVEIADEVNRLMTIERDGVQATDESYARLAESIKVSAEEIASIAKKTTALTDVKQSVIESVERLIEISQQNAAGNQEVTSNVEEISSDASNIYDNCDSMNRLAEELKESINYFKI